MTYISPAMREQINVPHRIAYSPARILYFSVLLLGLGALFFYLAVTEYNPPKQSTAFWTSAIVAVVAVVGFCFRILPTLLSVGQPAVIISREGLRFGGKSLIPWDSITDNVWHEQTGGIFSPVALRTIRLCVDGRQVKQHAHFFKCTGEDYLHYCEIYSNGEAT